MGSSSFLLFSLIALLPPDQKLESRPLDPVGTLHIPIGLADSRDSLKSFVEAEGGFSPGFATYGISYWIYDRTNGKLHAGTDGRPVEHGLSAGGRLIPWSRWSADGVEVWSETCQVERDVEAGKLQFVGARGRLRNLGRELRSLSLFVAIRPIGPAGGPIHSLQIVEGGRAVKVDGQIAVYADPVPTAAGASATDTLEADARTGHVPELKEVESPSGDGSGLLRYDVSLSPGESRMFRLVCPVLAGRIAVSHQWDGTNPWAQLDDAVPRPLKGGPRQPELSLSEAKAIRADDLFYRAQAYWDDMAGQVKLTLPDHRWSEAFAAITSHVALAMNEGAPDVAVVNYNVFNRDGVYVTNILQKAGRPDLAERAINYFLAHPFSGRIQPESDNPGQILWSMGEHWKFTQDRGWLIRVKPSVTKLASMIRYYRTETGLHWVSKNGLDFGAGLGSSDRLELKPGACDGFHPEYTEAFDIAGLRAAAMLAQIAGDPAESKDWQGLADTLLEKYTKRFGDRLADDYGSYCVLWPCRLYPIDQGVAFGQFSGIGAQQPTSWRYFPLAKSHQGLLTGRREAGFGTLDLHLSDPQMMGWYAFDEGGKSGAGGWRHARTTWNGDVAMPHGWSIAEFQLLLRDSLCFEDGDQLVLWAGIPPQWFRDPRGFSVERLPTHFGLLSFTFEPNAEGGTLQLTGEAKPPGGFRLRLPDGKKGSVNLIIPNGKTSARLIMSRE